jgi:PIN like domain
VRACVERREPRLLRRQEPRQARRRWGAPRRWCPVEVHDDHFPQDAPDELWLPEVGRRGWAVLTKDDRIRYRQAETTAASAAGVALFIFTGKGMRGTAIADALVQALPAMAELLEKRRRPFVAKVSRVGAVTLLP